MTLELTTLLVTALALGSLHALDADHILAVTGLSGKFWRPAHTLNFCLRWASGHGFTLITLGVLLSTTGYLLPRSVRMSAELGIALMLLSIGALLSYQLTRDIQRHRRHHQKLPPHKHRLIPSKEGVSHSHKHTPIIIGIIHGIAGSAQLLALLPLTLIDSPLLGLSYILLFSLGTLLAMSLFGIALSGLRRRTVTRPHLAWSLRGLTIVFCLGIAAQMLANIR